MHTTENFPTDRRPLGFWLRTVDGLLTREFRTAFAESGTRRGEWMLLNAIDKTVEIPGLTERLARRGKRLDTLVERGWIVQTDAGWELTDEGRAAKEALGERVGAVRAKVAGAVSAEDFATTMASLEAIARELGWTEGDARDFRFGGRGFGRRGFGPHGVARHGCGRGDRRSVHADHAERAERAYERGFDAGFSRGRTL